MFARLQVLCLKPKRINEVHLLMAQRYRNRKRNQYYSLLFSRQYCLTASVWNGARGTMVFIAFDTTLLTFDRISVTGAQNCYPTPAQRCEGGYSDRILLSRSRSQDYKVGGATHAGVGLRSLSRIADNKSSVHESVGCWQMTACVAVYILVACVYTSPTDEYTKIQTETIILNFAPTVN